MKVMVIDPTLVLKLQEPKLTLVPKTVYDLDDDIAKRLISSNYVVQVKEENNESKNA